MSDANFDGCQYALFFVKRYYPPFDLNRFYASSKPDHLLFEYDVTYQHRPEKRADNSKGVPIPCVEGHGVSLECYLLCQDRRRKETAGFYDPSPRIDEGAYSRIGCPAQHHAVFYGPEGRLRKVLGGGGCLAE